MSVFGLKSKYQHIQAKCRHIMDFTRTCIQAFLHCVIKEYTNLGWKNVDILQSVIKIMGKTTLWTIFCFSPPYPLNNVEKKWAKLMSSDVTGSQHCIGGEGDF